MAWRWDRQSAGCSRNPRWKTRRDRCCEAVSVMVPMITCLSEYLPSGKVDGSRGCRRRDTSAIETASITAADGGIDGCSVVCHSITLGPKFPYISKDLVGCVWIEGRLALVDDVFHPVCPNCLEEAGPKQCMNPSSHGCCLVHQKQEEQRGYTKDVYLSTI